MTREARTRIPVEDLVDSARVPLTAQIEEQPGAALLRRRDVDSAVSSWGDGMSADADGE